jgi:hypothetical protein
MAKGKIVAADPYGTGDSSRLDQWIGFVGALAFILLLIYTQHAQ